MPAPHQEPYFPPTLVPGAPAQPGQPGQPAPYGQLPHPGQPPGPGQPPYPAQPPARKHWGIPSAIVGLALFLGGQLVFGLVGVVGWLVVGGKGTPPAVPLALVSLLPSYLLVLGWQVFVARTRGDGVRADYVLAFRWYDLLTGVAAGAVAMGGVLGGTVAVSKLTGVEVSSAVGDTVLDNAKAGVALYAFLVVLAFVGPFVEEILFRGLWWRALRNRMGPVLTLLLTSALFAVIHLEPVRMVGLFVGGLALGAVRLLSNRLAPSIVAHVMLNTISAVSLLYVIVFD